MGIWGMGVWGMGVRGYECLTVQDDDKDSKLSLEDYRKAVEKERLLIEAFGPCLPPRQNVEAFCASLFNPPNTTPTIT